MAPPAWASGTISGTTRLCSPSRTRYTPVHEEHQVGEKVAAVFLGNYISIYNGKNTPQYETLQKKKTLATKKKIAADLCQRDSHHAGGTS
jgi:hypothetical protein